MLKLLELIALYFVLITGAGVLTIGLILVSFFIKKKIFNMNEEKWEIYFKNISSSGFLLRGFTMYTVSLFVISILSYFIFNAFSFEYGLILSIGTFVIGIVKILILYFKNKDVLLEKLKKLK